MNLSAKLGTRVSDLVYCISCGIYRVFVLSDQQRWCKALEIIYTQKGDTLQYNAIHHVLKTTSCSEVVKYGKLEVIHLYERKEEWWHEGNMHSKLGHC